MRVHNTDQAAAVAARSGLASTVVEAPETSFASVLAASTAKKADALPKGPKGETTREVPGRDYVEVMSGPRNGMFINTSDNARRGEAFVRIRKDDRDLHIYGSGKNREVVTVMHDAKARETTRPVEHHDYVEITSGARKGMYINTSDNGRRGEAFVLVEKADHNLHIYGSGKDRRVIIDYNGPVDSGKRAGEKKGTQPVTGGARAPETA
jgi:hypothetical protein